MPGIMGPTHLAAFLEDVGRANRRFRRRTSSLRGLLDHLEATAANPQPMTAAQARARCVNPGDGRLGKYAGAIDRLVSVWGSGAPYPGHQVAVGRIVFRGDSRPPPHIFSVGFQPRQAGALRYRSGQQDIDPNSAVAVSAADPRVAANFPLPGNWGPNAFKDANAADCWVYAAYLERAYNTAGTQAAGAMGGNESARRLLYARELATSGIPAHHVLGCIKVWRNFIWTHIPKPDDWISRGMFRFERDTWQANPGYRGPNAQQYTDIILSGISYGLQPFPT